MKKILFKWMALCIAMSSVCFYSCSKDDDFDGGNITPTSQDDFEFELDSNSKTAMLTRWKNEILNDDVFKDLGNGNSNLLKSIIQNNGQVPQIEGIELRDLVIPSQITVNGEKYTVTSIDENVFSDVYNLRSIKLPSTITKIYEDAFYFCINLQKINIPSSITYINNESVFEACVSLTSIDVDSNNSEYCSVDGVLFTKDMKTLRYYPCGKKDAYTIPNSVESIGLTAFTGAIYLPSITWGDNITNLGARAFQNCKSLKEIKIKDGIEYISENFDGCSSLEIVDIPSTVNQIGKGGSYSEDALDDCDNIKKVIIRAQEPPKYGYFGWDGYIGGNQLTPTLYVPKESIDKYREYSPNGLSNTYLSAFSEILPLEDYRE